MRTSGHPRSYRSSHTSHGHSARSAASSASSSCHVDRLGTYRISSTSPDHRTSTRGSIRQRYSRHRGATIWLTRRPYGRATRASPDSPHRVPVSRELDDRAREPDDRRVPGLVVPGSRLGRDADDP